MFTASQFSHSHRAVHTWKRRKLTCKGRANYRRANAVTPAGSQTNKEDEHIPVQQLANDSLQVAWPIVELTESYYIKLLSKLSKYSSGVARGAASPGAPHGGGRQNPTKEFF